MNYYIHRQRERICLVTIIIVASAWLGCTRDDCELTVDPNHVAVGTWINVDPRWSRMVILPDGRVPVDSLDGELRWTVISPDRIQFVVLHSDGTCTPADAFIIKGDSAYADHGDYMDYYYRKAR